MKKIIALIASIFFALQGCAIGSDIINDVKHRRETTRGIDLDISDIAAKYISIGEKRDAVEQYFASENFEFNYHPKTDKKRAEIYATRDYRTFLNIFGFYEVRIIIVFEDDVVNNVWGKLFYHSL